MQTESTSNCNFANVKDFIRLGYYHYFYYFYYYDSSTKLLMQLLHTVIIAVDVPCSRLLFIYMKEHITINNSAVFLIG